MQKIVHSVAVKGFEMLTDFVAEPVKGFEMLTQFPDQTKCLTHSATNKSLAQKLDGLLALPDVFAKMFTAVG